jgi:N-acyl-D-aspartate/D-glutamate deacylase
MNAIERNGIALNVSFLVPLSALRFYVLGDEAAERAATEQETAYLGARRLHEPHEQGAARAGNGCGPRDV